MFPRENPYLPLLKLLLAVVAVVLVVELTPWGHALPAYGLLALVGAAALFAIYVVVIAARSAYLNWFSPKRSGPAEVTRKWTREYDYDLPTVEPGVASYLLRTLPGLGGPTATVYEQWVFLVAFRVGEEEIELSVPERVYTTLDEGTTGILTYRGERFVSFRPVRWERSPQGVARQPGSSDGSTR
jgi:hypothetical protein